jgi:hypothetical protein
MQSKVFISYRRDDLPLVEPVVKRVTEALPIGDLFFDGASIEFGEYWRHTITTSLRETAAVMLVAIGDSWLGPGPRGSKRLKETDDMVREEIELGLANCELVVPVLLGDVATAGMQLPTLPPSIAGLWDRQVAPVRTQSFDTDVEKLFSRFVDRVVMGRMSKLETLSLANLAVSSDTQERDLHATALVAARHRPTDPIALQSAGICELRHRNYQVARELLQRALQLRDHPRTRYYLAIAAVGGRRPFDLPEWEVFRILNLLEPDGVPIGPEAHYRALSILLKLDYFRSHGRIPPNVDDDIESFQSLSRDEREVDEILRLVPTADRSVRSVLLA